MDNEKSKSVLKWITVINVFLFGVVLIMFFGVVTLEKRIAVHASSGGYEIETPPKILANFIKKDTKPGTRHGQ